MSRKQKVAQMFHLFGILHADSVSLSIHNVQLLDV